jgi:hypothetical protein
MELGGSHLVHLHLQVRGDGQARLGQHGLGVVELHSALYTAHLDVREGHREPIGIRQGRTVLYWREGLKQLLTAHRAALAAGEDYAVIRRLAQTAS